MSRRHQMKAGDWVSVVRRMEELVAAGSGEDPFEVVLELVLARLADELLHQGRHFPGFASPGQTWRGVFHLLAEIAERWPGLLGRSTALSRLREQHLHTCASLLGAFSFTGSGALMLDSLLETISVPTARARKGQFFTPRHVVEACVRMTRPRQGEWVLDPCCGSGGFLVQAWHHMVQAGGAPGSALDGLLGFDLDPRAIRVAKVLMLATTGRSARLRLADALLGADTGREVSPQDSQAPASIHEYLDSCNGPPGGRVDVILTNPPFAGELRDRRILDAFQNGRGRKKVERDVLFLEKCVGLLRPGGRIAIVLPHGKLAVARWAPLRRWLLRHLEVRGVVSLPSSTFQPHTGQRTCILLGRRRSSGRQGQGGGRILFQVAARSGKDSRGRPILRETDGQVHEDDPWRAWDHDLEDIVQRWELLEGGKEPPATPRAVVVPRARLDHGLVLAPERYDPRRNLQCDGLPLGGLVELSDRTLAPVDDGRRFTLIDTTHASAGLVRGARRALPGSRMGSSKKLLRVGDVIVSRLRPYLRQVALVDAHLASQVDGVMASTEFVVLRSPDGRSIAFLVPYLLSGPVQEAMAAAQEGGLHPRVPHSFFKGLLVPHSLLERRDTVSRQVEQAVSLLRRELLHLEALARDIAAKL